MTYTIPPDAIAGAQEAQRTYDVFASCALAQAFVESSMGQAIPPGSNNWLGIKALPDLPTVTARTREETTNGQSIYIEAQFAAFPDVKTCFIRYGKLIAENSIYAKALAAATPEAYLRAMDHVYATGSGYSTACIYWLDKANLKQYDIVPAKPKPALSTIREIQTRLNDLAPKPLVVDGIYGPATQAAIVAFQYRAGLEPDGIVGPQTLAALAEATT
jgi:hypothetical protein